MKAAGVMVSAVISVSLNARVEEVARTLLTHRISAVPVVNEEGELLGIVSEGDLMRRAEPESKCMGAAVASAAASPRR